MSGAQDKWQSEARRPTSEHLFSHTEEWQSKASSQQKTIQKPPGGLITGPQILQKHDGATAPCWCHVEKSLAKSSKFQVFTVLPCTLLTNLSERFPFFPTSCLSPCPISTGCLGHRSRVWIGLPFCKLETLSKNCLLLVTSQPSSNVTSTMYVTPQSSRSVTSTTYVTSEPSRIA